MENLLDKLFKNKMENRSIQFDENEWIRMLDILEDKQEPKRVGPIWLFIGVLTSFMIGIYLITLWTNSKKDDLDPQIIENAYVAENTLTQKDSPSVYTETAIIENSINEKSITFKKKSELASGDIEPLTVHRDINAAVDYSVNSTKLKLASKDLESGFSIHNSTNEITKSELLSVESLVNLPELNREFNLEHMQIEPAFAGFVKPIENHTRRPEFGLQMGMISKSAIDQVEIGLYHSIGWGSRFSIYTQLGYQYLKPRPVVLAEETGNIYSFDVSNYTQAIIASQAHGLLAQIGLTYHISKSTFSVLLHNQFQIAVRSNRIFEQSDNTVKIDKIWTDRSLYDKHQLHIRAYYDYQILPKVRAGVFYDAKVISTELIDSGLRLGVNLKYTI